MNAKTGKTNYQKFDGFSAKWKNFFFIFLLYGFLFCWLGLMIENDLEKSHLDLSAIKQKKTSLLDWSHFASKSADKKLLMTAAEISLKSPSYFFLPV